MKIQVICNNCGKTVKLNPETNGNICYVSSKLNKANMSCDVDIDTQVTTGIEDINDIDVEFALNSIIFTCNEWGEYIELNNLT